MSYISLFFFLNKSSTSFQNHTVSVQHLHQNDSQTHENRLTSESFLFFNYKEFSHIKAAAPDKLPQNRIMGHFLTGHGQEVIQEFQKADCLIIFLIFPLYLE